MSTNSGMHSPALGNSMKYILVSGGVISGVGKGIISSSLGVLLKNSGYRVTAIKIDPYLNVDAGTFSPYEHGEVFVLDDGGEVDLDLGNYERFLDVKLTRDNNITSGKIFQQVIDKERRGDYMGKTVQMIPHVTDAIVEWIERVARIPVDGSDDTPEVCIIELGGTIGDLEGSHYLHAFQRFMRPKYKDCFMNVHVSLVIHPKATGESKTKPMQNSVRQLRESGLSPDLLIVRSTERLDDKLKKKISDFGLVDLDQVIGVHDVSNIYKVPLLLEEQGVLDAIKHRLRLPEVDADVISKLKFTMEHWTNLSRFVDVCSREITIAIVGKYVKIEDAYASVKKALSHAAIQTSSKLIIKFLDSEMLEDQNKELNRKAYDETWEALKAADGIVVPGGFDKRGVEGKILCCKYARENKIPFLGICLGMQCAAIEFARNVCGIAGANSTEFAKDLIDRQQIVIDMPEHDIEKKGLGGTMRLGKRTTAFLTDNSVLCKLYEHELAEERHRHRYEVNPNIVPELSSKGLLFVGMGVDETNTSFLQNRRTQSSQALMNMAEQHDDDLMAKIRKLCLREGGDGITRPAVRMEIIEMQDHPYFVGAQYHPEYISSPLKPSPPFLGLMLAANGQLERFLKEGKIPSPMVVLHGANPETVRLGLPKV